jgi:hypothetical protein
MAVAAKFQLDNGDEVIRWKYSWHIFLWFISFCLQNEINFRFEISDAPPDKSPTAVYVGKIASTIYNDFFLSLLRVCFFSYIILDVYMEWLICAYVSRNFICALLGKLMLIYVQLCGPVKSWKSAQNQVKSWKSAQNQVMEDLNVTLVISFVIY